MTFEEARDNAEDIAYATERRHMPPWLPEPGYGNFAGSRRMEDGEIAIIQRWVREGMAHGAPEDLPPAPEFVEGWQLGDPDLVVEMPEVFTLPPADSDIFRSFVIPTPPGPRRYVRSVEFRPGSAEIVHHAVLTVDDTASSRLLDDEDPGLGFYTGMDAAGKAYSPAGHFLGWTPGKVPSHGDERIAWRFSQGSDLVLQLHMLPSDAPRPLRSSLALYFSDAPPSEEAMIVRLGSTEIDIPAGERSYLVEDSYVLPVDVEVLAIYPHAHYLGRDMKAIAHLPDGSQEWLLWIKEWDFLKQDWYDYENPVMLPAGTRVEMRFTYDNSADNPHNRHQPPARVIYGPDSEDEMGDLWLQVVPARPAELARLQDDFMQKERDHLISGLRKWLAETPDNATQHYNLAVLLHESDQFDDAVVEYGEALRLAPALADAHNNLGVIAAARGNVSEAVTHYREALRLEPDAADVHVNLGRIYLAVGRNEEAITLLSRAVNLDDEMWEAFDSLATAQAQARLYDAATANYRSAIRLAPELPYLHLNLGTVLGLQGDFPAAEEAFRTALLLDAGDPRAHNHLGVVLERQQRLDEAIEQYRLAIAAQPDYQEALANLERALRRRRGGGEPAIAGFEMYRPDPGEAHFLPRRQLPLTDRAAFHGMCVWPTR